MTTCFSIFLLFNAVINATTANVGSFHQASANWFQPQIYIDLPDTVYALEGSTLNVYFFNVIRFDLDWSLITNTVSCSKGSSDGTRWTYTPTLSDVGSTTLTIVVNRTTPFEPLFSKTFTLVTRPVSYPVIPVSRKLIMFGDSTMNNGLVAAQLVNLFSSDANYTLTEVGPNTGNANDSNSVSRAVATAGWSGATFGRWYTNTTTAWTTLGGSNMTGSPFVTNGVFSFNYWLTNSATSMSSGDWVVFNLGINGIFAATTDGELATYSGQELDALTNMTSSVVAAVPGVRIGVALTIPPNQSTNAFVADYDATQTLGRYRLDNHEFVENLLASFGAGQFGVTLIPLNSNIDTVNNMANGVHPANSGYWQIADTIRAFLKGVE